MSCSKFMRAECDGRSLMIAADGSWYWNEILRRKRRKKRSKGVYITVDPGDLPPGVKFVGARGRTSSPFINNNGPDGAS